ncbi:sensor histidine kinase [Salinibacterium sp. SWN1162]|uniref:sensor histidine kinase n=1 Tax=Salinibacterium sp. SWN1162 TaxID=2792053 RepID=UPI0018CD5E7E|nr:sensor histidine kinase [Salinibacterium sp. SWN1162]MBH0009175.1 sensor histidine kinase [Salinibacterium sp. SWN1162]
MPSSSRRSTPRASSRMLDGLLNGAGVTASQSPRTRRLRRWMPVVVSLLVQVPITIAGVIWTGAYAEYGDAASVLPFRTVLELSSIGPGAIAALALSVMGPLLLLRIRQYPGPLIAVISALAAADFLIGYSALSAPYMALAFAIVIAISHGARTWTWVSMIVVWEATLLAGLVVGIDLDSHRVVATTIGLLLVLAFAEVNRRRREQLEHFHTAFQSRREEELRAERTRIARELHDVLAHSLSQINVQAGVGLHLMHKQPEQAEEALASIKRSSKEALDEVRSLLGMLRNDGTDLGDARSDDAPLVPEPDLSRLVSLVDSVRAQGLAVHSSSEISEQTAAAVQLALYRIVQESLTNVVRHASATTAVVSLAVEGDDYLVTIADDGVGIDADGHTEGRGLVGMRERAELLGGTLTVRESAPRGTVVTARIPRRSASV